MSTNTLKSQQQSNKDLLAEKKSQLFSQKINTEEPSLALNHISPSKLEKLKLAVNKAFYLNPNEILLNENVRSSIDSSSEDFIALKNSIAQEGILQPVVIELREKENDNFTLVAINGHRRILSAQQLGLEKILCVIKSYSENDTRLLHGLTENLLRSDLEPLDIAEGYAKLVRLGWKKEDIAEYFGKNTNYVYGIIRLAAFRDDIKKIIRENREKFSMRVLVNEFSKKNWPTQEALLEAVSKKVKNKERVPSLNLKNEKNKKSLEIFYQLNPEISDEVKIFIEKALEHFKLF